MAKKKCKQICQTKKKEMENEYAKELKKIETKQEAWKFIRRERM